MSSTEKKLKDALDRLQVSAQKVVQTRGYTKEVKSVRALEELIREQLNANSRTPTRQIR